MIINKFYSNIVKEKIKEELIDIVQNQLTDLEKFGKEDSLSIIDVVIDNVLCIKALIAGDDWISFAKHEIKEQNHGDEKNSRSSLNCISSIPLS